MVDRLQFAAGFLQDLVQSIITLFVVLNPIKNMPLFQALIAKASPKQKSMVARKAVMVTGTVLVIFAYLGDAILIVLHITLSYIMLAGGAFLLVFAIKDTAAPISQEPVSKKLQAGMADEMLDQIAAFPIAIPLLAGPGAISTVMVLNSFDYGAAKGPWDVSTLVAIVVDCMLVWVLFGLTTRLARRVGTSAMLIAGKVMNILTGAIGVSFLIRGATAAFGIST